MTKIYFNKPYGVLSQFTKNEEHHRTLDEFNFPPGVYAAGRLDYDSEGLLLLTDDGPLIKKMLDPKNKHPRCYWVQVEGVPTLQDLKKLEKGVKIGDYKTQPCKVSFLEKDKIPPERTPPIRFRAKIPTTWIVMELIEGKNRQVRRMTASIGFPTLRLIRYSIGDVTLEGLKVGEWRTV